MPPSARFGYLDGIRALAILSVIVVHWGMSYTWLGRGGYVGVDVFFVLSGFVITTVLWRSRASADEPLGRAYGRFVGRRVRRLYPALLGLVVLGPLLWVLVPESPLSVDTVVERAALTAAQLTWVVEMQGTVMEPFRQTWSLGIEWFFYLTWPVAVFLARRRGVGATTLARWSVGVAVVLYIPSALLLDPHAFYAFPGGRFSQILAGGALALWFVDRPPTPAPRPRLSLLVWAALAATAAYVVVGPGPWTAGPKLLGAPLATATALLLIHHGYAADRGRVHRLLESRPMTLLGLVSYSLYLWHWLPLYLLDKDALRLPMPVLALTGVTLVVVLTTLSYLLLERPFLKSRGDALRPSRREQPGRAEAPPTAPTR